MENRKRPIKDTKTPYTRRSKAKLETRSDGRNSEVESQSLEALGLLASVSVDVGSGVHGSGSDNLGDTGKLFVVESAIDGSGPKILVDIDKVVESGVHGSGSENLGGSDKLVVVESPIDGSGPKILVDIDKVVEFGVHGSGSENLGDGGKLVVVESPIDGSGPKILVDVDKVVESGVHGSGSENLGDTGKLVVVESAIDGSGPKILADVDKVVESGVHGSVSENLGDGGKLAVLGSKNLESHNLKKLVPSIQSLNAFLEKAAVKKILDSEFIGFFTELVLLIENADQIHLSTAREYKTIKKHAKPHAFFDISSLQKGEEKDKIEALLQKNNCNVWRCSAPKVVESETAIHVSDKAPSIKAFLNAFLEKAVKKTIDHEFLVFFAKLVLLIGKAEHVHVSTAREYEAIKEYAKLGVFYDISSLPKGEEKDKIDALLQKDNCNVLRVGAPW